MLDKFQRGAEASAIAVQETVEAIEDVRMFSSEVNNLAVNSADKSE